MAVFIINISINKLLIVNNIFNYLLYFNLDN